MTLVEAFDKKINERDAVVEKLQQKIKDDSNKPKSVTSPLGEEYMMKREDAEKLLELQEKYEFKSIVDINPILEHEKKISKELFSSDNVSLYDELMKNHSEQIFRITALSFSKDNQDVAMEKTVGFIEQNFNINSVRTNTKRDMWIEIDGVMVPNAESYIKEIVRVIFKDNFKPHIVNNIILKIEADTMVDMEEFFKESNPNLIALQNDIYNIEEKSFNTYKTSTNNPTFFSKIKTIYDNTKNCPVFIKHLQTVLSSQKDIDQIQEFFGYCLLRDYPIAKVFLWIGDGRNGKGFTSNVLANMIGIEKNVSNITLSSLETYPFSVAQLHGKHVNIIGELEQKKIESTEKLKTVTGNDPIEAPRKNTSYIMFRNYAKFLILGNELFPTRDMTPAFFERIAMIDFKYQFVSKYDFDRLDEEQLETGKYKLADPSLKDKLSTKDELEGVLQWAIGGLHRVLDNKEFTVSRTTEETKQKYLRKSNNMTAFLEEMVDYKYDTYIEKKKFKYIYTIYCRKYQMVPTNDKILYGTLTDFGAVIAQRNNVNTAGNIKIWDGITFKKRQYEELIKWGNENGFNDPVEMNVVKSNDETIVEEFLDGGK